MNSRFSASVFSLLATFFCPTQLLYLISLSMASTSLIFLSRSPSSCSASVSFSEDRFAISMISVETVQHHEELINRPVSLFCGAMRHEQRKKNSPYVCKRFRWTLFLRRPTVYVHGDVVDEGQQVFRPLVCVVGTVLQVTDPVSHHHRLKNTKDVTTHSLLNENRPFMIFIILWHEEDEKLETLPQYFLKKK